MDGLNYFITKNLSKPNNFYTTYKEATYILKDGGFLCALASIALLLAWAFTQHDEKNQAKRPGFLVGFVCFVVGLGVGWLMEAVLQIDPSIYLTAFLLALLIIVYCTLSAFSAGERKFLYLGGPGIFDKICVRDKSIVILNYKIRQTLRMELDPKRPLGGDYRSLAGHLHPEYNVKHIQFFGSKQDPTESLLEDWSIKPGYGSIKQLCSALEDNGRHDVVKLIDEWVEEQRCQCQHCGNLT